MSRVDRADAEPHQGSDVATEHCPQVALGSCHGQIASLSLFRYFRQRAKWHNTNRPTLDVYLTNDLDLPAYKAPVVGGRTLVAQNR